MQHQQGARIDLAERKACMVKKIGTEKAKKYFNTLSMFLSNRLSKSNFDKSCYQLLGRENISLHNQLIRSILKNGCVAKDPPPTCDDVPANSVKVSICREDALQQSGFQPSNQDVPVRLNGASPLSIQKKLSRNKLLDRLNPPTPNGRIEPLTNQSLSTEDSSRKFGMENGDLRPCKARKLLSSTYPDEIGRVVSAMPCTGVVQETEKFEHINHSRSPLVPPLGVSFCHVGISGIHKPALSSTSGDSVSCYDSGSLHNTFLLKKLMDKISAAQGLEEVSLESANTLNHMLDLHLKKLIQPCCELVGRRSTDGPGLQVSEKQQIESKVINGVWFGNHTSYQKNSSIPQNLTHGQRQSLHRVSLRDFRVAMELNPQQLGPHWHWLLERICMHPSEE